MRDKRDERDERDERDGRDERTVRTVRKPVEVKYTFRVQHSTKKPIDIWVRSFRRGSRVTDKAGNCYTVSEIYWTGNERRGWKGDVLLKPLTAPA